ncbi:hypothetical protein J2752_000436 [Halarchaeum rubridurum]|uniref:Uncharacterized protein n=1 Tax=Halarchaeum rubridurum TaxID=489911 RepID=A0A8T4GK59_9EURY|nr:hypothetical protein [Halarchaeum rubridurum]MBP1953555.1 hypothetical protein [Halarchaeum rubridurum]
MADVAPSSSYQPAHSARRTHAFESRGELFRLLTDRCILTMSTHHTWPADVREHNLRLARLLKAHFDMSLKTYKLLKAGALSVATVALATYAIQNGAAPGLTAWIAFFVLLVLNGVEVSELAAVWLELQDLSGDDTEDATDE